MKGAIDLCSDAARSQRYNRGLYRGSQWSKVLQACLVAWVATDRDDFASTATRFLLALLDDKDVIGDGRGGDTAASQDSGYAIRNHGPYTALAYDWLYDHLSDAVKARARRRWAAWLAWYREQGYRARVPGSNYHAGYLSAATLIAVAEAGEAGEEGDKLWIYVADELWGTDMAAALAPGGVLEGGDWPEGWQYGPLAVASYSLSARVARDAGIEVKGIARWLGAVLRRHVYGLSPSDGVYAGGDTEFALANLKVHVNTLDAIALGDALPEDRQLAKGELLRLGLADRDYLLYDALASVGPPPRAVPRTSWPLAYLAKGTGTFFTRTRWDKDAVWFVAECQHALNTDHRHPNAGNFVLSRGNDDLIVDPSPYGSQSTLTSNAPTVTSAQFPAHYRPSQGVWGKTSGWRWTKQTPSGLVVARCDYADQYRFQHKPSDIPRATRDFVMVPERSGADAVLVVIDRALTTGDQFGMDLRFRVPAPLRLGPQRIGLASVGDTQLSIQPLWTASGTAELRRSRETTCYRKGTDRGQCNAARIDVSEMNIAVPGPAPAAITVIGAQGSSHIPNATMLNGANSDGIFLRTETPTFIAWPRNAKDEFQYNARRASKVRHVIFGAGQHVRATRSGDECRVSVTPSTEDGFIAVTLDEQCSVQADASATSPKRPTDLAVSKEAKTAEETAPPRASLLETIFRLYFGLIAAVPVASIGVGLIFWKRQRGST